MSETLKLRYKVGQIEFEAEGSPETVEQQRVNFMNGVLPAAVDAMVQTHQVVDAAQCIEPMPAVAMLDSGDEHVAITTNSEFSEDFSRTSLASFLKKYGPLTEQDFTLFAAYFDERKNNASCFSINEVKRYYEEARRVLPTNPSYSLTRLAQKGFIMDVPAPADMKNGKCYRLTTDGMGYIEKYTPKEKKIGGKKNKVKRACAKVGSSYGSVTADDLNLKSYPLVKDFKGAKEQIILVLYILTNEEKGEWFTVDDVTYLMINIFELPCDNDKVNGVIKRNKSLFQKKQDENNKRAYSYKLLSGAKEFARSLIEQAKQ